MTIDATHLPELVDRSGYSLMLEEYDGIDAVYPLVCDVRSDSETNLYGDKGDVLEGIGAFKERDDGQEVERDIPGKAYTWYCKIRQLTRSFEIPQRMLDSIEMNEARLTSYVRQQMAGWGEQAVIWKDDHVAGMFQKGTLTAGSIQYFDGSFPNNADPNPGVIYDALPWFDTAHTQSGGSSTFANHTVSSALTSANLETTLTTMRVTNAYSDRGTRVTIRPDTLLVPQALRRTATKIIESELEPGVSQNDVNVHRGELQVIVWPALTDDTDAWWVLQRGRGLRAYDSGAPVLETNYIPERKVWLVTAETRFGAVVTNWRYHYCNNKAAS